MRNITVTLEPWNLHLYSYTVDRRGSKSQKLFWKLVLRYIKKQIVNLLKFLYNSTVSIYTLRTWTATTVQYKDFHTFSRRENAKTK